MENFETLLKGSAKAHGHICPGQAIGVRMAMLGCKLIGLDEPRTLPQIKKLVVYVEIDRCATDAISFVTGVKSDLDDISKDDFKSMMFDLDVGAGVDVWLFFLEWHYVFGLTPVFASGSDAKIQSFVGNLGIRIKL